MKHCTEAAAGVIERTLPGRSGEFVFESVDAENGLDLYEFEARGGAVQVRGTTPVAMCRGAYEYLRRACGCYVGWQGSNLSVGAQMPDHERVRVVCPHRYRHYYNVCTFSYTTAWWDWPRWQREIDWMALHGINMPLSHIGQCAIWQRVWRDLGIGDDDLANYFNGPAFLSWFWMGNNLGHAAPLTQNWIDSRAQLQKRIMARQLELGMTPVTPGFAGYVPPTFAQVHPEAKLLAVAGNYEAARSPTILDPRDPMFVEIGKSFVGQYRDEYGSGHIYLCDTFNEVHPPFPDDTKLDDLATVGRAVYDGITSGDEDGAMALQAWTFGYDSEHWPNEAIEAYFSRVPRDRLFILDLSAGESASQLPRFEPLRNQQWVWCVLHNFGQGTAMFGNLQKYGESYTCAMQDAGANGMIGAGATPEGIEQNEIVYEWVFDLTWSDRVPDVSRWLRDYVGRRYGSCPDNIAKAWQLLERTVYRQNKEPAPVYVKRPLLDLRSGYKNAGAVDMNGLRDAIELFLACAGDLKDCDAYRRDLADFLKQHLANVADAIMVGIAGAYRAGNGDGISDQSGKFLRLLDDIDTLLETRPEHRLATWVAAARSCASTESEADHYEWNARLQVTRWGGPRTITDYAHKEWSGLIRDYYVPRWTLFFDRLQQGVVDQSYDEEAWHEFMDEWEENWPRETRTTSDKPVGDTIAVAKELFACYRDGA